MSDDVDILVTLSAFGADSDRPLRLLEQSGFTFSLNPDNRRMKPDEVIKLGRTCQGVVASVEEYSVETLAQLPNLRCISRCGVGIDNIDLREAKRRGIAVLNTPDEPVAAVAEMTLGMMLSLLRELPQVNILMHERKWQRITGSLLAGKTIGLIGLGRIGRRVAELVQAFEARVIGVEPYPDLEWIRNHAVELVTLPALLGCADVVSIHAAASLEEPFRLGAAEFAQMKPGARLINMARGAFVDDVALSDALASGHLSGAGLDVFPEEPYTGPLCQSDRVLLSPHQASLTLETRIAMETRAVENLVGYLQGEGKDGQDN
jgi:D-3-phosphoglycerate dehydrogenase